jgi:hypothetical protein
LDKPSSHAFTHTNTATPRTHEATASPTSRTKVCTRGTRLTTAN